MDGPKEHNQNPGASLNAHHPNQGGVSLFFSCPELLQSLDLLRHLVENTELILLVKGVQGAGKTTMLYQFLAQSSEHWLACRIDANPMMQHDQLLSRLAAAYGVPEGDGQLEDALVYRLEDLRREGLLPVVAIDDAHLLPVATLKYLYDFCKRLRNDDLLLRLVLFASPDIDGLLDAAGLKERDGQLLRELPVPGFDREQSEAYINHFLHAQGLQQSVELGPAQLEKVILEGRGLPGHLEAALLKLSRGVSPAQPRKPIGLQQIKKQPLLFAGGALVLLLIVVMLTFQSRINELFGEDKEVEPAQIVSLEVPAMAQKDGALQDKPESVAASQSLLEPEFEQEQEEPEPVRHLRAEEEAQEVPDLAQAVASMTVSVAADQVEEPSPAIEVPKVEVASDMEEQSVQDEGSGVEIEVQAAEDEGKGPGQIDAPRDVVEPERAEEPQQQVKPVAVERREAWLLQQSPGAYTLQLLGVGDEAAIKRFIRQHGLGGEVAYFQTQRQGRPWFSLLYGVYPDRSAAVAAKAELPPKLRRADVWPRSLGSVHKEISP